MQRIRAVVARARPKDDWSCDSGLPRHHNKSGGARARQTGGSASPRTTLHLVLATIQLRAGIKTKGAGGQ
jgi:hypothetical protein